MSSPGPCLCSWAHREQIAEHRESMNDLKSPSQGSSVSLSGLPILSDRFPLQKEGFTPRILPSLHLLSPSSEVMEIMRKELPAFLYLKASITYTQWLYQERLLHPHQVGSDCIHILPPPGSSGYGPSHTTPKFSKSCPSGPFHLC